MTFTGPAGPYTTVQANKITGTRTSVAITVPGQQQWTLRTVYATVTRGAGGTPGRYYVLALTDGTSTLAQVGAADAGTDPGTCAVTWANMAAASTANGNAGFTVAPLPPFVLPPAHILTVTIGNPVAGDTFTQVNVWYDYVGT